MKVKIMKLSVKKLAVYLSLLAIGGGAGLLGGRFILPQSRPFQDLKAVTVGLPPQTVAPNPVGGAIAPTGGDNVNFIATAVQKTGPAVVRFLTL
jgi:hypothetical protein